MIRTDENGSIVGNNVMIREDIKDYKAQLNIAQNRVAEIERRLVSDPKPTEETWWKLVQTRNELLARIELINRKLQQKPYKGQFQGYEPH